MAEPFLSEIRIMCFGFAPKGWALAMGSCCPSTRTRRCSRCWARPSAVTGDVNFALPDLRGRAPIHVGSGHTLGEGAASGPHALDRGDADAHCTPIDARARMRNVVLPAGNLFAKAPQQRVWPAEQPDVAQRWNSSPASAAARRISICSRF